MTERERKEFRKKMVRLLRGTERRKIMFGKLLKEAANLFKEKEFFLAWKCCSNMASLCWDEDRAKSYRRDKESNKKFGREMKKLGAGLKKLGTK